MRVSGCRAERGTGKRGRFGELVAMLALPKARDCAKKEVKSAQPWAHQRRRGGAKNPNNHCNTRTCSSPAERQSQGPKIWSAGVNKHAELPPIGQRKTLEQQAL